MGMYDTVLVRCPQCGTPAEFQSKSGNCKLATYTLDEAPDDVLLDVNRHAPATCEKCGALFGVEIGGPRPQRTLGAHSKIWEAPDEAKEICHTLSSDDKQPLSSSDDEQPLSSSDDEQPLSSLDDEQSLSSWDAEQPLSSLDDEQPLSSLDDEQPLSSSDAEHASASREFVQRPVMKPHETELHCAGSYYSWSCTCGKGSRHLAPLHCAIRNAQAHERKALREEMKRR